MLRMTEQTGAMPVRSRFLVPIGVLVLLLGAPPSAAQAQSAPTQQIDELARDVARVESVRAVKDLQRSYAQYAQFGLWDEMAALFSQDARVVWGDRTIAGGKAISAWLKARMGGRRGLAPGALHTELTDQPLVNLSVDGMSAKARWEFFAMTGDGKGGTGFEGGILENEYALEDGHWKISLLHFHPSSTAITSKAGPITAAATCRASPITSRSTKRAFPSPIRLAHRLPAAPRSPVSRSGSAR